MQRCDLLTIIVLLGCYGGAVLIVSLADGAIHVAIKNEGDSEQRWFSTNGKHKELPFDVQSGWFVIKR